jgi:hypothetical protein
VGETTAAWAGAVATLLAVLVALFGPAWERGRRSPLLHLVADPPAHLGAAAKVVHVPAPAGDSKVWLRLAVVNAGRSTAEGVRVTLARVEAPQPLTHPPPLRELKWADVPFDSVTLAPGEVRLVDLLHVAMPDGDVTEPGLVPGVMRYEPGDDARPGHRLWLTAVGGGYAFHLTVSARDVPAGHYVARVDLRPESAGTGEVARQLGLTTVDPVS